MIRLDFILMLLFAFSIGALAETTRFEVYPLAGAEIESATELVRTLAGPEGQVTSDPVHQRLLVVTTADRHAHIAEAMRKMAVPARNVLIEVRMARASDSQRSEFSVTSSGEWSGRPGGFGGTVRIEPRIENRVASRSGQTAQMLLIGSGREGVLRVGEHVPHLAWIMDYGRRNGFITAQWEWQDVGSFLTVQPTVIGDGPMIRVRIVPELRGRVNGRTKHLRFATLATELVVRDGETIPLGGLGTSDEFASRFLVGAASGGRTETLDIHLTPRIQPSLE